ncbi:MAG: histidine--tRNA ligase [Candidatus Odinarchaeum yellowstonii]|uniref:Histidine--tRNA ligase n=1 Tax=Odinarchaeota yellowstonii (strain LCB_4) TaxID=1841599 RepID=A0AAF0IBQ8_ODILC|nr:MAG: histidine--tRNA ligase [Candidatus Odinarchaeum yellowstonii]
MSKTFRTVRGMRDYLKEDKWKLNYVNNIVRELYYKYNYDEVSTPIVEFFDLVAAKAGAEIREKMYVFEDKGGRLLALRPEMTAPIARLYIENLMRSSPKPVRLGYIGTCYRYDNPQRGRYREFWQAGFELFGSDYPESDIEILNIAYDLMLKLGFTDFKIRIGHIGVLRSFFNIIKISEELQDSILGSLDKKEFDKIDEIMKENNIPENIMELFYGILKLRGDDYTNIISQLKSLLSGYPEVLKEVEKFTILIQLLSKLDIIKKIEVDMSLARGLEYYTGLIFEIFVEGLEIAVGGGGRYDKLVELFGGERTPAVGFAAGIDRLIIAMEDKGLFRKSSERKILITPLTPEQIPACFIAARKVRELGYKTEVDVLRRNIKRALSYAVSNNYSFIIFIGEKEERENKVTVKKLDSGEQHTINIDDISKILMPVVSLY